MYIASHYCHISASPSVSANLKDGRETASLSGMQFIFEVHLKPGYQAEQYAAAWVRASQLIQRAPGAQGTRLHRKIGDPSVLLAIATWASKADRDAMEEEQAQKIADIIESQAEFVVVHLIGEFEDPEWVVLPDTAEHS